MSDRFDEEVARICETISPLDKAEFAAAILRSAVRMAKEDRDAETMEGAAAVETVRVMEGKPVTTWTSVEDAMPTERHAVLVQVSAHGTYPVTLCVGYWKQQSKGVLWVTPGVERVGREVTHWLACLPGPLNAPGWPGTVAGGSMPSASPVPPASEPVAAMPPMRRQWRGFIWESEDDVLWRKVGTDFDHCICNQPIAPGSTCTECGSSRPASEPAPRETPARSVSDRMAEVTAESRERARTSGGFDGEPTTIGFPAGFEYDGTRIVETPAAPTGTPQSWDDPRLAGDPNKGRTCLHCGGIVPAGTRYQHTNGRCVAAPTGTARDLNEEVCSWCNGSGHPPEVNGILKDCDECDGTGAAPPPPPAEPRAGEALRDAAEMVTRLWADFTSQEMYGEFLRGGMTPGDFAHMEKEMQAIRDALSAPATAEAAAEDLAVIRGHIAPLLAAKCRGCPHAPHLGTCNGRLGATVHRCACSRQTPSGDAATVTPAPAPQPVSGEAAEIYAALDHVIRGGGFDAVNARVMRANVERLASIIDNLRASHDFPRVQDVFEAATLRARVAELTGELAVASEARDLWLRQGQEKDRQIEAAELRVAEHVATINVLAASLDETAAFGARQSDLARKTADERDVLQKRVAELIEQVRQQDGELERANASWQRVYDLDVGRLNGRVAELEANRIDPVMVCRLCASGEHERCDHDDCACRANGHPQLWFVTTPGAAVESVPTSAPRKE